MAAVLHRVYLFTYYFPGWRNTTTIYRCIPRVFQLRPTGAARASANEGTACRRNHSYIHRVYSCVPSMNATYAIYVCTYHNAHFLISSSLRRVGVSCMRVPSTAAFAAVRSTVYSSSYVARRSFVERDFKRLRT